ncbi:nitrate reductase cytochrome c-type subunit [Gynuella sp.]|uniref:nitrate reductase cytochrome c-type subunit n=1 Tax=Gynuella sp. TaxID=2969146 RepID=UPI003D0C3930
MKRLIVLMVAFVSVFLLADNQLANLRGDTPLDAEGEPPKMKAVENSDLKRERAYPQQAPTIPHDITGYQVDLNFNRCLACHSRKKADEAQAPMVSITHYMNRDGQFLADVSPRRFFCTQCHITQQETKSLIENTFVDMDTLVKGEE